MASNPSATGRKSLGCTEAAHSQPGADVHHKNPAATSAQANQNGDQAVCGDGVMPEQEALERRRSATTDARSRSGSPSPGQRPSEELPRRNFQIPRKTRERKGLYQFLPPDSREFEELLKVLSSYYLDPSSRGSFSYCKARLIHNELLKKEFIEKRREMKQDGRSDAELSESYCFLYPDKSKLHWICEKGLSAGHSKITTLGNPSVGVYLSKYSDLLQMNPFEVGASGDIVVFKVMKGRIKHIHENVSKKVIEPTPKFDTHLSKSVGRVTSLLSYRAFELTQQYFYEFAFEEIRSRPRHICPYAVVSFKFRGKEAAAAPMTAHRFSTFSSEGSRRKSYTVWSGPLVNKGQELFPISLRSSSRPFLPFKLPDKLEVSCGMKLDQLKKNLPPALFSWDTYRMSQEVMRCGLSCSLLEVVDGKRKATSGSLAALVHRLEKDQMVLVKSLFDRGFLFLLSSAQMGDTQERRTSKEKNLLALFIFQGSRTVVKPSSRVLEPEPSMAEPHPSSLTSVAPFLPALHFALMKLRSNPGKDLSSGVERHAADYLTRMDSGAARPFVLPEYKPHVDERAAPPPAPRPKFNMEAVLRSYVHNPANYMLPLNRVEDIVERTQSSASAATSAPAPTTVEYSPVSDWGGSDRGSDRMERTSEWVAQEKAAAASADGGSSRRRPGLAHSNGAPPQHRDQVDAQPDTQLDSDRPPLSKDQYDKNKMKQLLKLIQLHKKALVKEPGKERGEEESWDGSSLKRKSEGADRGGANKHQRTHLLSNGETSQGPTSGEGGPEGGRRNDNLTTVMENMGIYDTDLRSRGNNNVNTETQRLLKILLATLNKAVTGSPSLPPSQGGEGSTEPPSSLVDISKEVERVSQTNYTEEDMDCSPGSLSTLCSPSEQTDPPNTSARVECTDEGTSSSSSRVLSLALDKNVSLTSAEETSFSEPKLELKSDPDPALEPPPESKPEPQTEPQPEVVEAAKPETPAVGTSVKLAAAEEVVSGASISLDTILHQELHSLHSHIKHILQTQHVSYNSQLLSRRPLRQCWLPNSSFSELVTPYVSPVPIQEHMVALGEMMEKLIPARPAPTHVTSLSPPASTAHPTPPSSPAPPQTSDIKTEPSHSASPPTLTSTSPSQCGQTNITQESIKTEPEEVGVSSPSHIRSPSQTSTPTLGSGPGLLTGSLISQLKPEVFSSLVEIFKDVTKNTVKFYIHSDQEAGVGGGSICQEIKDYLTSLGNSECSPQTFLENSGCLDKLLIIIRNEDIAAHVHKVPALVSLKKLPSVSFAGVDSLDDVKNHTYNELFVSGGLMVSDEFVLNPDLITQERLQGLLQFLEEQSTPEHPWQWKVHCKSQKKLKELGRLNSKAMALLNLLTSYQKKHLVEFLPYHDCDAPQRHAPDLECLIKLQAQHTQQRHLIFLTERPFEMFLPFSRNGIIIASIDDVMTSFHSLIGSIKQSELPTPPSTVVNDECVEEDMSLDSDDGEPSTATDPVPTNRDKNQAQAPDSEDVQAPLVDLGVTPETTPVTSDLGALKTAISQFRASVDHGSLSPGGFPVNPHQSFLCPSGGWPSFGSSSSYPASPCSSTQEQEHHPPAAAPVLPLPGPLANLASLPLEVKPPPPPHLMMLGHTYSSDPGGGGASGGGSNRTDPAQPGFISGLSKPPTQPDRTHNGPGGALWLTTGTSTGEVGSGPAWVDLGGLPHTVEPPGGHGAQSHLNCTEHIGVPTLLPPVATGVGPVVGPPPPVLGVGYGGIPGQRGRGNYRGRGVPPGLWTGPVGGPGRGGGPCSWGYPAGRGGAQSYYSDFTNSHH